MTKRNYEQLSQEYKRYEMTDLILLKANLTGNSMLFTDMERIPGFKAENYEDACGFPLHEKFENLVLWDWVSKEGITSIKKLIRSDLLDCWSCSPLLYYYEGVRLDMPLAKSMRSYKKPRWFPMAFGLSKKGQKYYEENNLFNIVKELHLKKLSI